MGDRKTLLIRGGRLVTADAVLEADLLIGNQNIAAIGDLAHMEADDVYDAGGLLVLPGGVDTHVHFSDAFMGTVSVHDFYSGTLAAAHGGATTVVDFANQAPGGSLMDCLAAKKAEARDAALIDYGIHPTITRFNQNTLAEIPRVVAAGAPTVKCYMTYRKDGLMMTLDELAEIQGVLGAAGGMLMVHAEDDAQLEKNIPALIETGSTQAFFHAAARPSPVEDAAIAGLIDKVCPRGGRLFVVHLASARGMEMIAGARARGIDILAETCIHYLVFTDDVLKREDGIKWICSPPLRSRSIREALWKGVGDGRIAMVTTDDAAFSMEAKRMGLERFDRCPNGIPGIEVRLSLLYSEGVARGRLSLPRLADIFAAQPARLFGLAPRKGTLLPGADADLVIFDPSASWTMGTDSLHMAADWCAYEGIPVTGKVRQVYSRGELIIDNGRCLAQKGRGRYLHRVLDLPRKDA